MIEFARGLRKDVRRYRTVSTCLIGDTRRRTLLAGRWMCLENRGMGSARRRGGRQENHDRTIITDGEAAPGHRAAGAYAPGLRVFLYPADAFRPSEPLAFGFGKVSRRFSALGFNFLLIGRQVVVFRGG